MQRVSCIKAPNHLLRIALSPNAVEYPSEGSGRQPFVAFSGSLHEGSLSLFKTRREPEMRLDDGAKDFSAILEGGP